MQANMAHQLIQRLACHGGVRYPRALEIGCGTGLLTEMMLAELQMQALYVNDLVDACRVAVEGLTWRHSQVALHFIPGDIECQAALPDRLDLVISNAAFQWLDDVGALLGRLRALFTKGGRIAFSTFGPANMQEFRVLLGATIPYLSCAAVQTLLARHFVVLHAEEWTTELAFPSPRHVLQHVRQTGSNALQRKAWSRAAIAGLEQSYRAKFSRPDGVTLTYHPMLFVAEPKACR